VEELHHKAQGEVKGNCNYFSHYVETNGIHVPYVETTRELGDNGLVIHVSDFWSAFLVTQTFHTSTFTALYMSFPNG
jgi:hypothetical protein